MNGRAGQWRPLFAAGLAAATVLWSVAVAAVFSGCQRRPVSPSSSAEKPASPSQEADGVTANRDEPEPGADAPPGFEVKAVTTKKGVATWYDVPEHSLPARRAWRAEFTAAHKRWPIGGYVRVTSLENGRSVIVRVTDRGPNTRGAAIDLCRPAAEELDMIRAGRMRVRLELLRVSASTDKPAASRAHRAELPQPTAKLNDATTREDEKQAARTAAGK